MRGRPLKSNIRQNIIEILYFLKEAYAYDLYKIYIELFPKVSMRSIYYHLKKGLATKEFIIKDIKKERGEYSWGAEAEKIYYALGPDAKPQVLGRVREHMEKKNRHQSY